MRISIRHIPHLRDVWLKLLDCMATLDMYFCLLMHVTPVMHSCIDGQMPAADVEVAVVARCHMRKRACKCSQMLPLLEGSSGRRCAQQGLVSMWPNAAKINQWDLTLFWYYRSDSLADAVLDHPSISGLHAAVCYEGLTGVWHIVDLGSTHGTFVDEHVLDKVHSQHRSTYTQSLQLELDCKKAQCALTYVHTTSGCVKASIRA